VQAALIVQQVSYRLLDEFRPTSIIVLNGLFYAEAILMEIANQRDIPVWTYERDKRVDALILARDISVLRLRYVEPWARRSQMPLNEVENAQLDDYLASRRQGNVGVQILWDRMDKADGVSADQKLAVLFTNVLWDTAVYEADVGFDSMIHWLQHTIAWFAEHPDYKLAIRIHPAEVRIPFKESLSPVMDYLPEIPANVQVIGPYEKIDSYALVDMAKLVLVYTSTIGLESVLFDTPIIVAGQTHYRDKGLSSDPKTIEEFDRNLEALLAEPKPIPEQVELARRYAYMYFFEEIIPFPFVREEPAAYASLSYRKNEVLAPGASSYMDTICDAILLQKQPTHPQPAKTNLL
jgi:hypothetical protein